MPVTILKGLSTSGVTLHKMTEEMDMGDIILKKSFKVDVDENLRSFMQKVAQAIDELIPLLVSDFERLYSNAEPQGDGEYWAMPAEENWTVTPDMELQEIDRIFRAFYGVTLTSDHYLTMPQIIEKLAGYGVNADRKTLYQARYQEFP